MADAGGLDGKQRDFYVLQLRDCKFSLDIETYADQNERDHQSLVDAVASGRITAEPDT